MFEHIKYIQIERYHKCKTDDEKQDIELDSKKIFYTAVENCKPHIMTKTAKRGGVIYDVRNIK